MVYDRYSGGTVTHLPGQPGFNVIPSSNPSCKASGTPAANCTTGPGVDPASSVFRVGFDGAIPVPAAMPIPPPTAASPYVPGVGQAGNIVFTYNPNFKMGQNHMVDFSIQRELPGNMIMEVGYIGRLGRRLPGPYALNADPYMFTDPASGQSFAQANDCVAQTPRSLPTSWAKLGSFPCAGSGGQLVANQPWFESQLPTGWGAKTCGAGFSNTQCIVFGNGTTYSGQAASFVQGNIGGVFGVFNAIAGANCGPNGQFSATGGAQTLAQFQQCSLYNTQENDLQQRTSTDFSNYHALSVTLRNRGWHGLQFDLNYTFAKSLDQGGRTQGFINGFDDSFNPNAMYGPSYFDRTHVFNGTFNYNLPFGLGHKLSSGHSGINRIIGGWSMSGVFRANSGLPLVEAESGFAYGGGLVTSNNVDMIPTSRGGFSTGLNHNNGNTATGSCAAYAQAMGGGTSIGGNSSTLGLNYFSDPAAYCSFRPILLTVDTRDGRGNPLRGFGQWNLDASFAKETALTERFKLKFSADFFNIFNHVSFDDPLTTLGPTDFIDGTNAANFGVITDSFTPAQRPVGSRWIQLGLRVEF